MNQLEAMRAALLRAGYTVSAVHAALQHAREVRDMTVMAALAGGNSLHRAIEIADTYLKIRK